MTPGPCAYQIVRTMALTVDEIRELRLRAEEHPEDVLTEPECADLLRMSVSALRCRRYRDTAPPSINIGGCVRYLRPSVVEWLKAHETPASTPVAREAVASLQRARAAVESAVEDALGAMDTVIGQVEAEE